MAKRPNQVPAFIPAQLIPRLYSKEGVRLCPQCKHLRTKPQFATYDVCMFCRLEAARNHMRTMENEVNMLVPKDRRLQEVCDRCDTVNWWTNLEPHINAAGKQQMWCASCRGDEAIVRWHEEVHGVEKLTEKGKITSKQLDELLEDIVI